MNFSFHRVAPITKRGVVTIAATLGSVVLIACGTEPASPLAASTPTPEILISREQAVGIALARMTEGKFMPGESSPVQNLREITVRFMPIEEYEGLGGGSGTFTGTGYGASGHVWVVQARVNGRSQIPDGSGSYRPTRYAIEAVNTKTGLISAAARIVDEPFFISAEYAPDVYELDFPADPATPTKISRAEVRQMIRDEYETDSSGGNRMNFGKMELELVHSAERGLLWWAFIPQEFGRASCSGPPSVDGRHFFCWVSAIWQFIDADTGAIYQGGNFGKLGPRVTGEEGQALFRFAQAEGWWELWHRLKPYTGEALPDGFAAALDRPDSPTPTPGPPTPTPDPNAPAPPTPTPVPGIRVESTNVPPSMQATASALARIPDPTVAFYLAESFAAELSDISADPHVSSILVGTALGIKSRSQRAGTRGRLEAKYAWWVIEVEQDIVNPHGVTHVGVWVRERFIGDSQTQLASANSLQAGGKYVFFLTDQLEPPDASSGIPVLPPEILPASISGDQVVFGGVEYGLDSLTESLRNAASAAGRPIAASE